MTPLSFCPEASPHSVCKVRVPSFPQFDSVKAWKQIKACCFSPSRADTEPVRTRLTRGSFATCCFCLWWGLRNFGTGPRSLGFFFFVLFFSPPTTTTTAAPLLFFCLLQREHEAIVFKIVFVAFFYFSNNGLEMFTVEQCVWQRSLCPVKALPLDRPRVFAKSERTKCSEVVFLWMTGRHFVMRTRAHFLIPLSFFVAQSVQFPFLGKKGTESSWLKGPRLLIALKKQNFTMWMKVKHRNAFSRLMFNSSLACVQF